MQVMYAQRITVDQLSQRQKNSLMFIHCVSFQSSTHYTEVSAEQDWHQPCLIISFTVLTDFHINTNTFDIPPSSKNLRRKASLPSASKTASQRYQGTFSRSVKTLLRHLQQYGSLDAPNCCKDARKTRKVHEPG